MEPNTVFKPTTRHTTTTTYIVDKNNNQTLRDQNHMRDRGNRPVDQKRKNKESTYRISKNKTIKNAKRNQGNKTSTKML